jgi:nucleoside diphosphate kinase
MKMEQIMAEMKAILKAGYKEMKYHQERMMVIIRTGVEEMKSIAVHEVVLKEEAAVKPVRALKRQHRGWHLATGHCRKRRNRPRAMMCPGRTLLLPAEG